MHLEDMRTISLIAELGSFGRAGDYLGLSQPAISHRVRQVERAMGASLFVRNGRGSELSRAGALFCAFLADLEERLCALKEEFAGLEEAHRTLTLAAPPPSAGWTIPALVREFLEMNPGARVRLLSLPPDIIRSRLLRDELDFAVLESRALVSGLVGEHIDVSARMTLVAPIGHPLAGIGGAIAPDVVASHPFVLEAGTRGRRAVDAWADAQRVKLRVALEVDSGDTAFAAIRGGVGVGFVSERAAITGVMAGQVVACETLGARPVLSAQVLAFRSHRVQDGDALAFLEVFRAHRWGQRMFAVSGSSLGAPSQGFPAPGDTGSLPEVALSAAFAEPCEVDACPPPPVPPLAASRRPGRSAAVSSQDAWRRHAGAVGAARSQVDARLDGATTVERR